MIYDDGTMDVLIGERMERRSYYVTVHRDPVTGYAVERCEPEHELDTELVLWLIGEEVPWIVEIQRPNVVNIRRSDH